jgi:hypothetical protein
MPLPLIPIAIATLAGGAWWAKTKRDKQGVDPVVTAQRAVIFDTAINKVHDGAKLRELAKAFRDQGLTVEADMLVKRAELNEAPPEVKKARQEAYRKGMKSTDIPAIRNLADAMASMGAAGAAKSLRDYATGLENAGNVASDESELGVDG